MEKFMGFCKGGRVRFVAAAGAAAALCFIVLCVAGMRSYAAVDHAESSGCTSVAGNAAGVSTGIFTRVSAGVSADADSTQVVVSPDPLSDDDLQIVLSVGELPESMCISWKGEADGPGYIKIAGSRKGLRKVKAVKASSEKTLEGSYYRYSVQFDGLEPGEKYYYVIGSFEEDDTTRRDTDGNGQSAGVSGSGADESGRAHNRTYINGRSGRAGADDSDGGQMRWVKVGSVRSFRMPKVSDSTQFLYLGDVQFDVSPEEYAQWGEMTAGIFAENPGLQFAVLGGDMVNIPSESEQWNGFLRNCSVFSRFPLMTVSGNHEGVSSNRTYKKMFAVPDNGPASGQGDGAGTVASAQLEQQLAEELRGDFYYFDQGSCRFIMTDSSFLTDERIERLGTRGWQLCEKKIEKWLAETLEESPKPWNIVVTHHPPYGLHDRDTVSPQLRELWVPVLETHGADLVLCGHQHMYMRTEPIGGIVYVMGNSGNMKSAVYENMDTLPDYCMVVSGDGPNYQIIDAGRRKLQLTSYDADGLIIDRFTIRKSLWEVIAGLFR